MAAGTTFFVRVFVYGLIGWVPGGSQTTALLPSLPAGEDHVPFVAFANGPSTCTPPCTVTVSGTALPGFRLDGREVAWTTGLAINGVHQRQPRVRLPAGFHAPLPLHFGQNHVDSTAFDWVAPMTALVRSPTIDPACMRQPNPNANPPCNPPHGLAGRLAIGTGTLSTCRLTEFRADGQSPRVHAYDFKPRILALHDQALAEIVESETQVTADQVKVTLTDFAAARPPLTAVLKPADCIGRSGRCVDIFVGNIRQGRNAEQETGFHFQFLYNLLRDKVTQFPLPNRDPSNSELAADEQPLCRPVPPPPRTVLAEKGLHAKARPLSRRKRSLSRKLDRHLRRFYPNQRVICPMASFTP